MTGGVSSGASRSYSRRDPPDTMVCQRFVWGAKNLWLILCVASVSIYEVQHIPSLETAHLVLSSLNLLGPTLKETNRDLYNETKSALPIAGIAAYSAPATVFCDAGSNYVWSLPGLEQRTQPTRRVALAH
jgi:hypothetical protein